MTSTPESQDTCQEEVKFVGRVTIIQDPREEGKYAYTNDFLLGFKLSEGFDTPGQALDDLISRFKSQGIKIPYPVLDIYEVING